MLMKGCYYFILVFFATLASGSCGRIYHSLYSSCYGINSTQWTRGSGPPLQSWWKSIVPLYGGSPIDDMPHPANLTGIFGRNKVFVKEVKNTKLNTTWRIFSRGIFDGWLYGKVDLSNEFTGPNIAYIYSDMTTVIMGHFDKGVLQKGWATKIIGYRCNDGLMQLKFKRPNYDENKAYTYERLNESFITSKPKLMDPLDHRNVFVGTSQIADAHDGLFAKRNLAAHQLLAIYSGVIFHEGRKTRFDFHNVTVDVYEDAYKNLMTYNDTWVMDVPPEYSNIIDYRASLGHKVNHNMDDPNTIFCNVNHPRFGYTVCLETLRPVAKGEELFVDYGYGDDPNDKSNPRWYRQLLQEKIK